MFFEQNPRGDISQISDARKRSLKTYYGQPKLSKIHSQTIIRLLESLIPLKRIIRMKLFLEKIVF